MGSASGGITLSSGRRALQAGLLRLNAPSLQAAGPLTSLQTPKVKERPTTHSRFRHVATAHLPHLPTETFQAWDALTACELFIPVPLLCVPNS